MKIQRHKAGSDIRTILTGMIVSTRVLTKIAPLWKDDGLFGSKWENLLGGWCVRHYRKRQRAPGPYIENIFAKWARAAVEKEHVKAIEDFLGVLSDDYANLKKGLDADFVATIATDHFNMVEACKLKDNLEEHLERGELDKAWDKIKSANRVASVHYQVVDVLHDKERMAKAFEERPKSIVKYPGDLGRFFGSALARDCFVCFTGAEKKGKTWWLIDLAFRGMLQHRRVLFFEIGDLTENQIFGRFGIRCARRPLAPKKIWLPKSIQKDGRSVYVKTKCRDYSDKGWLTGHMANRAQDRVLEQCGIEDTDSFLNLVCTPARTISADDIRVIVDSMVAQDWPPDIVVVDYDALLAPMNRQLEKRLQIDEDYIVLNKIRQQYHCLVVTASQIKATGYKVDTTSMEHFSDSKSKLMHTTSIIGINQNDTEKEEGVQRLNFWTLREDDFLQGKCCTVAGCLSIANPCIRSLL